MDRNWGGFWIALRRALRALMVVSLFAGLAGLPSRVQALAQTPVTLQSVVVLLRQQPDLSQLPAMNTLSARQQQAVQYLRGFAASSQFFLLGDLRAWQAQGQVGRITPLWIVNAISLEAGPEAIAWLEQHPAVAQVRADEDPQNAIQPLDGNYPGTATVETNLVQVNAQQLWSLGIYGQGVTVAIMDTGVDITHPDLADQWRGGTNSWFDPYGQYSAPVDIAGSESGHGTAVAGIILGRNHSGRALGMAPQAQWIAARLYNTGGRSTETAIHQAYQWVLDPDGDPLTADAPQVVNSSWGFVNIGCNQTFRPDVQAMLAAGILPVFSAGNNGPLDGTSISPANYPESFAVGAVNAADQLFTYSSRGPNACDAAQVFPAISAPGVHIYTTDLYGMYYSYDGTSMSAPHAAGALALLLSYAPGMAPARQYDILTHGAHDLGDPGPDRYFGYGRLDVYQSWYWMLYGDNPVRLYLPAIYR
ncbi:MAG TPA: S8 family serine peptidase [Anaerolineaceae bacterium]|nr:S8 family serine peptidase [Anaerolineaceae bacterium]